MANPSGLRICSYNCRSIKSALPDIVRLCDMHDIICIQEHWLLPNELSILSNLHNEFYGFGSSAVDISSDVLVGRPYGGTGILYRKSLCASYAAGMVHTTDTCFTGLKLVTGSGPLLVLNVYMPTDYGDEESLEKYTNVCANICATFTDCDIANLMVIGDFNCHPGTRFYDVLSPMMTDNNLVMSDIALLSNVFTYISDNGANATWIDHVLASYAVNNSIATINVLYDYVCSDHRPMSVTLNCLSGHTVDGSSDSQVSNDLVSVYDWARTTTSDIETYQVYLICALCNIVIPEHIHCDCDQHCRNNVHKVAIDMYYNNVIEAVKYALKNAIPNKGLQCSDYNVPGWNDVVQDKYNLSREAFIDWVALGKPRSGTAFQRMSRLRASFKLAFRYCKQHEEQLRLDSCAKSLDLGDAKKFWHNVYKISNDKVTKYANCINGAYGDSEIVNMWKSHFEKLYNSVDVGKWKEKFYSQLEGDIGHRDCFKITVQDVYDVIQKQKKGKSAGPDGVPMEAYMYGSSKLFIHMSLLFSQFIKHCHLPPSFMKSVIVPLVKSKSGDLTDMNNYRAIALSNTVSKILETLFLREVNSASSCDSWQFGFKTGHSTAMCTRAMKDVVEYYTGQGSHVFVSFVDFSKAFDKVNYWKLFGKLLDDSIDMSIVAILAFWYSNQVCNVRWKTIISDAFFVGNGTRQGGVLSPYFFTRYIRELIYEIINCNVGCNIGGVYTNLLVYADDMVLLAPSWGALQYLINLLASIAERINMTCNAAKTVCMIFQPVCKHKIIASAFPTFTINGQSLSFVKEFRYLGHIVNNQFSDNDDIRREIRNLFIRTNILIRRYGKCSRSVKLQLFKAYCMCLYDIDLWRNYTCNVFNKIKSCYNKCVKLFFGYDRHYSVTLMLAELNLPGFDNLFEQRLRSFNNMWLNSSNFLVSHVCRVLSGTTV